MRKTRVLVVDDSSFIRLAISESLSCDPDVEVVGTAANGRIALARVQELKPDVITLDVDMPEMDGLTMLRELRYMQPHLPVIMCSSLTEKGAVATLDALALGATCYVTKPTKTGSMQESLSRLRDELLPKIKALGPNSIHERRAHNHESHRAAVKAQIHREVTLAAQLHDIEGGHISQLREPEVVAPKPRAASLKSTRHTAIPHHVGKIDIVVIGVSTGGPNALATLLPGLPANFPVPVAIVQHMPALFTKLVAERLDSQSSLRVHEAKDGELLLPGDCWIAPGDQHMILDRAGRHCKVSINQDPPVNFCRPSVDVLFRSAVRVYGANVLGVILTGMGSDGTAGCQEIRENGGQVLVQDEATSVVWGMPGSVAEQDLADAILPIGEIAREIVQRVSFQRNP
ncbi:MAG: chemotaxis response regulator protein-glutamate methylesterase [Verrucomicrobiota bacterium]